MRDEAAEPEIYQAEHLREALARDPRVGELGIEVEIDGASVVLRGTMTSPEQQEAAIAITGDFLPGHLVRIESTTPVITEPAASEHLP
jgi:hypothetical protein